MYRNKNKDNKGKHPYLKKILGWKLGWSEILGWGEHWVEVKFQPLKFSTQPKFHPNQKFHPDPISTLTQISP